MLYLLTLAIGLFAIRAPVILLAVAVAQVVIALAAGVPPARIAALARKLLPFGAALAVTFAFFPDEGDPQWLTIPPGVSVSVGGLVLAGLMLLRLFAIVLASEAIRGSDPSAFARGLRGIGAPSSLAATIDVTLRLLGGQERGRGRGMGGGRGRRAAAEGEGGGLRELVRGLAHGDIAPLVRELDRTLHAASVEVARQDTPRTSLSARDVAVVGGMATAMLAFKVLKVLPGIPFAPGHKTVLLIPLYILSGALTETRWGATLTGATMGTIAFLMGDGRYGVFEILKHVAPGVLVDLCLPILRRPGREPGVAAWCVFGLVVALGRFAAVVAVTLLVAAPGQMWVLLAVPAVVHLAFGVLSGFVSFHVMRVLDELRASTEHPDEPRQPREQHAG
jgi:hypothetical protein